MRSASLTIDTQPNPQPEKGDRRFLVDYSSIHAFRDVIEHRYEQHPTGCGGSFGEILCFEIHEGDPDEFLDYDESIAKNGICKGVTFRALAKKWGVSLPFLGEVIADHCRCL